jgi:hypothetical protein
MSTRPTLEQQLSFYEQIHLSLQGLGASNRFVLIGDAPDSDGYIRAYVFTKEGWLYFDGTRPFQGALLMTHDRAVEVAADVVENRIYAGTYGTADPDVEVVDILAYTEAQCDLIHTRLAEYDRDDSPYDAVSEDTPSDDQRGVVL